MATIIRGLFLPIIVFFVASFSQSEGAFDFRQFCQRTTHSGTCIFVILADPRINLRTTPNGLGTILNDKAKSVTATTSSKISTLLKRSTNPKLGRDLQICSDIYDRNKDRLKQDFSSFNRAKYLNIVTALGGVFDEAGDCERIFKEPSSPIASPLTVENQNLRTLVETTLQILNLIECNKIAACIG
ncbi:hypothetical protein ACH5RR_023077 [Cinchona calisaya]|uniref:Pectinesterase inhibitor domain-containing protein n=1 Tax=Cinchona calisaya TaxID=153742 RepID=A0ABD2ZCX9_9GENT